MPLNNGHRLDQHHGVEDMRPNPVKPGPEEPVGGEELKLTWALPPQDGHLMSQGDELNFQRSAATEAEGEQRSGGGKIVIMRRLVTIPGVGAITAASIKALVPDPDGFKSGRHFAAWLGLTPKPHSSGGKERLGGISKMGNPMLRSLLVLGATSVLRRARGNANAPQWPIALLARRPFKVVAVALANKMARIIWALLTKGGTYRNTGPARGAASV